MASAGQYVPLKWPDESLKKASLYHLGRKARKAFNEMMNVVEDRGEIPADLWGHDPRRCEIARQLSRIIKHSVGWSSDNFIPDDPFDLLCWGGFYDLQEVEVIVEIERLFVIDVGDDQFDVIWKLTLGQLVDYLLANAACPVPWSTTGADSLEERPCPSYAAFVDIEKFVQKHCRPREQEFRPSSGIRSFFDDKGLTLLSDYVCERFGVKQIAHRRFLSVLPPFRTWLVLSVCVAMAIKYFLPTLEWHNIVILMLPVSCAIGVFIGRSSPLTWRSRIVTVRDLIMWILRQRASA
jgi:hypothetical protein